MEEEKLKELSECKTFEDLFKALKNGDFGMGTIIFIFILFIIIGIPVFLVTAVFGIVFNLIKLALIIISLPFVGLHKLIVSVVDTINRKFY